MSDYIKLLKIKNKLNAIKTLNVYYEEMFNYI